MFVGLEDKKLRKVNSLREAADKDQLLALHINLTAVQTRLLEILTSQFEDVQIRNGQQQEMQRQWTEFTGSWEVQLDRISINTTNVMRDLFLGLLSLQSLTHESARLVGEEIQMLSDGVENIQSGLYNIRGEMEVLGAAGKLNMDALIEIAQKKLLMV